MAYDVNSMLGDVGGIIGAGKLQLVRLEIP
jgi:hypothetical protein